MNKINRVKVIENFPGYKIGDVLELDPKAGVFYYIKSNNSKTEDVAFDILAAELSGEIKATITKKEVSMYLGDLFADISTYKIRSSMEIEQRVNELKAHMDRVENDDTLELLDKEEALTVWQNMLWEYEWIMGMRELYFNSVGDQKPATKIDYVPMTSEEEDGIIGYVDGNELERQNESDNLKENR